jgi:K+-transporting ATPase ATPase B chain
MFQGAQLRRAAVDSARKLSPRVMLRNPVMFVVEAGGDDHHACAAPADHAHRQIGFTLQITLWLWFTVLFANFAEAIAEARGKAQADAVALGPVVEQFLVGLGQLF